MCVHLVTNPFYALPFTHHMDSCTTLHYCCTSPQTTIPIIHCTDDTHTADCTDDTYTAGCSDYTPYLSHGLPQSDGRVLYSVYQSPSNSYVLYGAHFVVIAWPGLAWPGLAWPVFSCFGYCPCFLD